ncbi:MAG: prepilin peptidase [Candidatus Hydrogenedentes bacterium]|nr:prepilin peptidase [Candidatus Hydrogenedentota bacterium]
MPVDEFLTPLNNLFMAVSLIMGLLVGSFCNVCVGRWPHGESVVSPRSRCPKCMNAIQWFDNIPLLSWLLLGAKCRHCKAPISWQYPLVEALTGVLFLLVYLRFGMTLASPIYMLLAAAMVVVTFQDLADWTIPDEITIPGVPVGLGLSVLAMFLGEASGLRVLHPFDALAGIVLGFAILYALDRITVLVLKRPGMGFGDVKLLAMLGAFIGWKGVLGTIMLASVLGSLIGVAVLLYFRFSAQPAEGAEASDAGDRDAAKAGDAEGEGSDEDITLGHHYLPFGPYLAVAGMVYLFYGPELLAWYLRLLGPIA